MEQDPPKKRGAPRGKPQRNYSWDALKLEFMQGPWTTTAAFRRDKGFSLYDQSVYMTQKMKGWSQEKHELMNQAAREAAKSLIKDKRVEIEKMRDRHVEIAQKIQQKGLEALEKFSPKSADDARKMIVSGLEQERMASGILEKGGESPNLTQVNVNLPKTKFDEMIDGQNVEGLLKLAADIRRERIRRAGENNFGQKPAEVKPE